MGYCPYKVFSHNTAGCIVTQGSWGAQQGATIRPSTLQHGPTTRPGGPATLQANALGEWQSARMAWPLGVSRDTMVCIVAGGDLLCHNTAQQGCDTAHESPTKRHRSTATRKAARVTWSADRDRHSARSAPDMSCIVTLSVVPLKFKFG